MKKIWLFSPFILSMLAAPLCGEQKSESEIAKRPVFAQNQKRQFSCDGTSNVEPMDYRLPKDFHGSNAFAEYLLWQTQEQASHFVIVPTSSTIVNPNYPDTEGLGTIKSASFDWGSGVRVGLSYTGDRDYWTALGQYTWYNTNGQNSYSRPTIDSSLQYLMPTSYAQSTTGTISASSSTFFSYQIGDFLACRRFMPTEQIQLNFSIGATGGYIKENFDVTYGGATINTHMHNNWAFGGGGFRAGIDSNWHIGYGFGVFGRFSFATILGQYTNTNRITADAPVDSDVPPRIAHTRYQGILLMPTTQIALGFDWCRSFTNYPISAVKVAIAGEFNNLANLQQVFKAEGAPSGSSASKAPMFRDLSSVYMYGGTLRFGVDY